MLREIIRKTIKILDGTPAVYGQRNRGQSVAELALVTPILIVLLMGLAEVGWFANNYLILMEATRVGARFGTVQSGDTSPLTWNDELNGFPTLPLPEPPALPPPQAIARRCGELGVFQEFAGFYNLIVCTMLRTLTPLELVSPFDQGTPDPNGVDDIVVSVFSLQTVNPSLLTADQQDDLDQVATVPANQQRVLVVGRYPINSNECTFNAAGTFTLTERDPFDYIENQGSATDFWYDVESNQVFLEIVNRLDINGNPVFGYDVNTAAAPENRRGFSWTGQHVIADTGGQCIGSEWTIDEVQELVNLPRYGLVRPDERQRLPSQGLVLVEMFWNHELLLKNPVFNPFFIAIGGEENTTISVWAAFPVPAAEPRIQYP
ncbi:MAG: pilus assembly protein [Anaerolineae bacterium]|nr:pilus assembly protein [Anaerolineae bacterium]